MECVINSMSVRRENGAIWNCAALSPPVGDDAHARFCVTLVSLRKRVHARASPSPSSWKKKKKLFFLYRRNQQPPSCRGLEIRISIRRYFLIWKRRGRGDVRRPLSARDAAVESWRRWFWRKILELSGVWSAANPPLSAPRSVTFDFPLRSVPVRG